MKFISNSEQETYDFAKKFASTLKGGKIIGLAGDLGAGKTVFTKGLAAGLGVKQTITSPTFVLMKIYDVKKPTIKKLVHIDAYRIKSAQNLIAIGTDEYFNKADTITIIEWVDKIKKILPNKIKCVNIFINNHQRIIKY